MSEVFLSNILGVGFLRERVIVVALLVIDFFPLGGFEILETTGKVLLMMTGLRSASGSSVLGKLDNGVTERGVVGNS